MKVNANYKQWKKVIIHK